MEDTLAKALIATVGVVAGALLTALAAAYAARQKTREIELTYQQKLQESYLTNARQYIQGVYAPLSIALTKLSNAYRVFRPYIFSDPTKVDVTAAKAAFSTACQEYDATVSDLLDHSGRLFNTPCLYPVPRRSPQAAPT